MDTVTRNWLILAVVVGAAYLWCKNHPEHFTALAGAPYDGPDDNTTLAPAGSAMVDSAAPVGTVPTSAVAAAQAADAAWQKGAQQINPYATNFVDSRAMNGISSNAGFDIKNMTWDIRGSIPIARNPSQFPFGLSSRMPPPPMNNKVFCGADQTKWGSTS